MCISIPCSRCPLYAVNCLPDSMCPSIHPSIFHHYLGLIHHPLKAMLSTRSYSICRNLHVTKFAVSWRRRCCFPSSSLLKMRMLKVTSGLKMVRGRSDTLVVPVVCVGEAAHKESLTLTLRQFENLFMMKHLLLFLLFFNSKKYFFCHQDSSVIQPYRNFCPFK